MPFVRPAQRLRVQSLLPNSAAGSLLPERLASSSAGASCEAWKRCACPFLTTITLALLFGPHLLSQQITTKAPPAQPSSTEATDTPPEEPGPTVYPIAKPFLPAADPGSPVIESHTQAYAGGVYTLDGDVVITYKGRTLQADHIVYDSNTGEVRANGHLKLSGGTNQEEISASRADLNLDALTGRFYDVAGSVGVKAMPVSHRVIYTTSNPFLFTGRLVVKTGESTYDIYDGTVTSCQLPHPDWLLSSAHFSVDGEQAQASRSVFRLLNVPILFLPYVTHPVNAESRQAGFLIPTAGYSGTRGAYFGEQIYVPLGRSADLLVGAEYFSLRGFSQLATFRYRGAGLDFVNLHYTGLLDRRPAAANQGGEDIIIAGRHDLSPSARVAANVEYLSSYVYREAFNDNFNQAITSDVVSTAYATRAIRGVEVAALVDRYQGIKLVAQGSTPQQQVRIFHAPTLSVAATEHRLGTSGLQLSFEASASGLKRSQQNFVTSGIVERFDLHPQAAYPLALGAWRIRPSVAARETFYTRSRFLPVAGASPAESLASLSRSDFEFTLGVRPPVLTRTFLPMRGTRLLGTELRHTIAPELTYRLTTGVADFARILRFDATDIVSNTNEAEYGVTQRLYRRRSLNTDGVPCTSEQRSTLEPAALPADNADTNGDRAGTANAGCSNDELISWKLTQKYFFDRRFGGAIVNGRRTIFDTTLDLSGVAFLTEPREISPLISRLRVRTSAHTDVEWDFDLDTGARKFTSSNVFLDLHQGNRFAGLSYARLDAPGRFYTQSVDPAQGGVTSTVSDFNQLRVLLGYGSPTKSGLSLAGNVGIDLKSLSGTTSNSNGATGSKSRTVYPALLQYLAIQTAYNWNCCGVSFEYRKFQLGTVQNEPGYRFSFTLANIGAAGNLRRTERLF